MNAARPTAPPVPGVGVDMRARSSGPRPPRRPRGSAAAAALVVAALLAGGASRARAQADEHRLRWSDDWARVHPAAYVVATSSVAATLFFEELYQPGTEALVRGPLLLDGAIRARLMAPAEEDRQVASRLSDVLLAALLIWPYVDSLGVAGLGDMNSDVAWQLSMVGMEAYAADLVVSTFAKLLVHRGRPHGSRCTLEDRARWPERCGTTGRTRSFFSGHSSAAFNAAGVVCISHLHVPLYGSEAADTFACGAALLTATTVAIMRVVADRHFASDVFIGAVSGLLTGMLLPYLLHYGLDPTDDDAADTTMSAAPLRDSRVVLPIGGTF